MKDIKIPFPIYGVPLLGLGGLLLCLWQPQVTAPTQPMSSRDALSLSGPDPRHNEIMVVILRQEANEVIRCRKLNDLKALAKAVDTYDLVAQECTPTVFQVTHPPRTEKQYKHVYFAWHSAKTEEGVVKCTKSTGLR